MEFTKQLLAFCFFLSFSFSSSASPSSSEPYAIVADVYGIFRMNISSHPDIQYLVHELGVKAVDYHYERDLLVWVNDVDISMKFTRISNATEITVIKNSEMGRPTGVAVDWINDRIYWIEQKHPVIRVYDLNTATTSTVAWLNSSTVPMNLKILPHSGLLFWGDKHSKGIWKISVNGTGQQEQVMHNVPCPSSVALNYRKGSIYTINCFGVMKTCKIDGSSEEIISRKITEGYVTGIAMYSDQLYWTTMVKRVTAYVRYTEMNDTWSHPLFSKRHSAFSDMAIRHSSNQPSESEIVQIGLCNQACQHGKCMQDGVCVCQEGWTGPDCATAIPNTALPAAATTLTSVSFLTTKAPLTATPSTSKAPLTTTSTLPSTSTAPHTSTAPPSSTVPHTSTNPSTSTATPTSTTPSTSTEYVPTSTASTISRLPSTTFPGATNTFSSSTDHPTTTTPSVSSSTSRASSTPKDRTPKTIASTKDPVPLYTSTVAPEESKTTISTSIQEEPSTDNTDRNLLQQFEEGLEKDKEEGNQYQTLIISAVTSAAALIILVVLVLYAIFLYLSCHHRRSGSYNVHKRHSIGQNVSRNYFRRSSGNEPGTESTFSSFRDLTSSCDNSTAHLHGRLAELGYGGGVVQERPGDIVEVVFRHEDTADETEDGCNSPLVVDERREHFNTADGLKSVVSVTNPIYLHKSI